MHTSSNNELTYGEPNNPENISEEELDEGRLDCFSPPLHLFCRLDASTKTLKTSSRFSLRFATLTSNPSFKLTVVCKRHRSYITDMSWLVYEN